MDRRRREIGEMTTDVTFVIKMEHGKIREQPRHAERSRD
jgi:hypothetical protein